MKIGLYFGSFNPIHVGHLIIANHMLNAGVVDQVWLVVSPQNPFKESASLLNEYDRLNMIELAITGETKLKTSSAEFQLPRPSYTVDTLAYLKEKHPGHDFSIIMGSDSFTNIGKWKNSEVILRHHHIHIFKRPGFDIDESVDARITIANAPLLEISSTRIRELIKTKKSIRYLVPDGVKEEIERNNYYK